MTGDAEYTVRPGDTLSAIAVKNNTTVEQLVGLNKIENARLIYPGQKLRLRDTRTDDAEAFFSELWIRVSDANDAPIPNLQTTVVTDTGQHEHETDEHGGIPPVRTQKPAEKVHVYVAKLDGGKKKVAELTPPAGTHQATVRSPKVKIQLPLRVHEGGADHHEAAPIVMRPGEVQHNRDIAGTPVVNIGVECPNSDNLRLGANNKYRAYIMKAAQRCGIFPQSMAALIEAEAAKMPAIVEQVPLLSKNGKPLVDKHGKPRTKTIKKRNLEWKPDAVNPIGAAGLTQFLPTAWREVAGYPDSALHARCAELAAQRGVRHLPDSEVLHLRLDPELSIMAAGEYASHNIAAFGGEGFHISAITGVNRAKLGYFLHHEGVKGATQIVKGTLTDDAADNKLAAQMKTRVSDGTAEADAYKRKVGLRAALAYRKWIYDYVDAKINPKFYACDPSKFDEPLTMEQIEAKLK